MKDIIAEYLASSVPLYKVLLRSGLNLLVFERDYEKILDTNGFVNLEACLLVLPDRFAVLDDVKVRAQAVDMIERVSDEFYSLLRKSFMTIEPATSADIETLRKEVGIWERKN